MYKKSLVAVTAALVTLTGCVSADREAGTVEYGTQVEAQLQAKANMYGTSIELERGLYRCEQAYLIRADHAPDHPASAPLAECVAEVYAAHGGAK